MKIKNIALGSVLALIGLFMMIAPATCIKLIVILLGLVAVIEGAYNLIKVYKLSDNSAYRKTILAKSLISIALGISAVIFPIAFGKTVASIWTVFNYCLAVALVLFAIATFYSGYLIGGDSKKYFTKEGLICLIIAAILFIIPVQALGKAVVSIIGVAALIIGIVLIAVEIIVAKKMKANTIEAAAEVKDAPATAEKSADKSADKSDSVTQ